MFVFLLLIFNGFFLIKWLVQNTSVSNLLSDIVYLILDKEFTRFPLKISSVGLPG